MNTEPTPYAELNEVLAGLVTDVQAILGGTLVGAYLQGSSAPGDGDMQSDCDFLFVLREQPSPGQLGRLVLLHDEIPTRPGERCLVPATYHGGTRLGRRDRQFRG